MRMRASGFRAAMLATASATEGAVLASIPALRAASRVDSAGRVFFSPGMETAWRRAAWGARGRM